MSKPRSKKKRSGRSDPGYYVDPKTSRSVAIVSRSGVIKMGKLEKQFIAAHFTPREARAFVIVARKLERVMDGPHYPKPCPRLVFACF